jgi:non-homologous end joining protein Ku
MPAARAYWKGHLKLSLVTCPVALYPASSQSEKTHFHQINRKTGNRMKECCNLICNLSFFQVASNILIINAYRPEDAPDLESDGSLG